MTAARRRFGERRDLKWHHFIDRALVDAVELPAPIIDSHAKFCDLLRDGFARIGEHTAALDSLSEDQWQDLVRFCELVFQEFDEHLERFPEFCRALRAHGIEAMKCCGPVPVMRSPRPGPPM